MEYKPTEKEKEERKDVLKRFRELAEARKNNTQCACEMCLVGEFK